MVGSCSFDQLIHLTPTAASTCSRCCPSTSRRQHTTKFGAASVITWRWSRTSTEPSCDAEAFVRVDEVVVVVVVVAEIDLDPRDLPGELNVGGSTGVSPLYNAGDDCHTGTS